MRTDDAPRQYDRDGHAGRVFLAMLACCLPLIIVLTLTALRVI